MEVYRTLSIVRKHLWIIILTGVIAVIGAFAVDRYAHRHIVYVSTATLALNPNLANRGFIPSGTVAINGSPSTADSLSFLVNTYNIALTNVNFAQQVIRDHALPMTAQELSANTTTALEGGTYYYDISVAASDPKLAQQAATSVAQEFLAVDQRAAQAQQAANTSSPSTSAIGNVPTNLIVRLTSISTGYWNRRIQQIEQQLLGVMSNARLTPDQQYAQIVSLEGSLSDAQANLARVNQNLPQTTSATAAAYLFNVAAPISISRLPVTGSVLLLAAIGGLILGLALAFVREYFDATLHSAEEISELFSLPVLSTITRFRARRDDVEGAAEMEGVPVPSGEVVSVHQPFDTGSEAFRNLRTSLLFADAVRQLRVIVVTSPEAREGKSVIAANLATVMAQAGSSVILVDSDMRRPTQYRLLGVHNTHGLSDLYLNKAGNVASILEEHLQTTAVPTLRVLAAGQMVPNPAELLASDRTHHIIEALRQSADTVIIDTPAMGFLSDALMLAAQADGTIFVVRANASRRDVVKRALTKLSGVNARLLGIVINMGHETHTKYDHYYGRSNKREFLPIRGLAASMLSGGSAKASTATDSTPSTAKNGAQPPTKPAARTGTDRKSADKS